MLSSRSLVLSLTVGLMCSLCTVEAHSRKSDNKGLRVEWTNPSNGDVFVPGDTIKAEWTSKKTLISPSVALCTSDEGDADNDSDCGELVWPRVTQEGKQSSFSLAVPEVASGSEFYLRMKDDFGNVAKSPSFVLHPGGKSEKSSKSGVAGSGESEPVTPEYDDPDGSRGIRTPNGDSSAQAPLHGAPRHSDDQLGSASASGPASHTTPVVVESERPSASPEHNVPTASSGSHAKVDSLANAPHSTMQTHGNSITTAVLRTPPVEKSNPYTTVNNDGDFIPSQGAVLSRAGVPTAAIAVPISLVGATILASIGLCVVHRRSLAAQRARNAHLISLQRNDSIRSAGSRKTPPSISKHNSKRSVIDDRDIEKAIDELCAGDDAMQTRTRAMPFSRPGDLRREDSMCYHPRDVPRYPIPRRDVRRERAETFERTYEWPSDLGHNYTSPVTRTPSHYSHRHHQHPLSLRPGYRPHSHSSFASSERSSRALHSYHGETSNERRHQIGYDHDHHTIGRSHDEDDNASSTNTILSNYVSPLIDSPRIVRYDSYPVQPRSPLRPHPRPSVREMSYHRWRCDDAPVSPYTRNHRSYY